MLEDPTSVDLVVARRDGSVVLSIFEERPWDGSESRVRELEEKVNAYLTFVLGGHMKRQHPDISPDKVTIRLDYMGRLDERTRAILPDIEAALADYGIDFAICCMREAQAG